MALYFSIALFASSALGGAYILSLVLSDLERRKGVGIAQGAAALVALSLLVCFSFESKENLYLSSILLFILAALAGITMLLKDLWGHSMPKWMGAVHGLVAVGGFAILVIKTFAMD